MSEETAEERAFLLRSLDDLDAERAAGDLDEEQFASLRERYLARLAQLGDAAPASAGGPPEVAAGVASSGARESTGRVTGRLSSRRARLVTGWSAFGCFAVAAVLLGMAVAKVGPFAPAPTLSKAVRIQIMLGEAGILGGKGDLAQAVATYDRVLALDPRQEVALAGVGWLSRLEGLGHHDASLVRDGDAAIALDVRVHPFYATARAYDGVALLRDGRDAAAAAAQFDEMLADHPTAALVGSVTSEARTAFARAHLPVPSAFR